MPEFRYVAADGDGTIEAPDQGAAVRQLAWQGILPRRLERIDGRTVENAPQGDPARARPREVSELTRQLAGFLAAGFPLARALAFAGEHAPSPAARALVAAIATDVAAGQTLAAALAHHPEQFDDTYLTMVRAGEDSGQLAAMFTRIAAMRDAAEHLRGEVIGALAYPAIMIAAMAGAVTLMMTLVIPRFAAMFADLGTALPLPTRLLMATSQLAVSWWWLAALGLVAGALGLRQAWRTVDGRRRIEALRDRLPLVGRLLREVADARFARTLALLLQGGVALVPALTGVRGLAGGVAQGEALARGIDEVKAGRPLGDALAATRAFDPTLVELIRLGEESGDIAGMLLRAAERAEHSVNLTLRTLTKVVEPLLILAMGLVVGGLVAAMLLPIVEMNAGGVR